MDDVCLVVLIWEDGLKRICRMKSCSCKEIWKDKIENYEIVILSELEIRKHSFPQVN